MWWRSSSSGGSKVSDLVAAEGNVAADAGGSVGSSLGFDPSGLERGAKALRELDNSPNATKAFEVIKNQEATKQAEMTQNAEKYKALSAQASLDKARVEGEERRQTVAFQQEQERNTAQYKARVEAELYAKKLEDQQKQSEDLLAKQHNQFLQHEELKLANEQRMAELRKKELIEANRLQQDLAKVQIREKTTGRIRQERENLDVRLALATAQLKEKRDTQLQLLSSLTTSIGSAAKIITSDRRRAQFLVGGVTSIALGVYGARNVTRVAANLAEMRLSKPPLVRETSRSVLPLGGGLLAAAAQPFRGWLLRGRKLLLGGGDDFKEELILPDELRERLDWSTRSILAARQQRSPFRHILLHGPPGTGKTFFAKTLAKESGMDYAIMTGGDVGPLGKAAVDELNKLFSWARKSRRGLILFIDEADAFLRRGRASMAAGGYISEELRNVLSTFLYQTGSESRDVCVVMATNTPDVLDEAVLDRVDESFLFPLPGLSERRRMLGMFADEYLSPQSSSSSLSSSSLPLSGRRRRHVVQLADDVDSEFWDSVSQRTEGLSGRQISKLIIAMRAAAVGTGTDTLTRGVAETVLRWRLPPQTAATVAGAVEV